MIKKLFTLGLVLAAFAGNAQQLKTKSFHTKAIGNHINTASKTQAVTVDTLIPSTIMAGGCADVSGGIVYYQAGQDSGYTFGTQIFPVTGISIKEVAQKYNVGSSAATVSSVLVWTGVASGTTTAVSAKIYSENTTSHAPNTAMGTSVAKTMAAYVTGNNSASGFTTFTFSTPVAVAANANFFASATIPAFGGADQDTLAILSTQIGCSSTDSLSWIDLNVGWYSVKHLFQGQNADLMIFPVINITTAGINDYVNHGDLSIYAASPNPASSSININFSVAKPAAVEIQVYDITGKVVKTVKNNDVAVGKNAISIDVTNLEAGSYMYSINANGNRMFSKFIVTK